MRTAMIAHLRPESHGETAGDRDDGALVAAGVISPAAHVDVAHPDVPAHAQSRDLDEHGAQDAVAGLGGASMAQRSIRLQDARSQAGVGAELLLVREAPRIVDGRRGGFDDAGTNTLDLQQLLGDRTNQ